MRWRCLLTRLVASVAVVAPDGLLGTHLLQKRRVWVCLALVLVGQLVVPCRSRSGSTRLHPWA